MLNINRKLSKKGFSLIELMVAVVILSIALIGIFLAFNSGWMGMADARDRTVATNYAQEILEDIKNTPFEKIHSDSSQIGDTKFSRNISSININPNVKEVTAQVTWDNWRGSEKYVEASTLIYSQISSEQTSEAVTLVLYAEPYYNVLPGSANTKLTVLVKDVNRNLVTDWTTPIYFSIPVDYSDMGTVPPEGFIPNNGKVTEVYFKSSGEYGDVVIVASSGELTNDSVTLKVTDSAVAIKLEADPVTISTGGQSTINVYLLNANREIIDLQGGSIDEHLVTFYVIDGPGTITPISVLLYEGNEGTSSITLTSTGIPGIVTIIASSMDLESGVVNVPILGTAESISITSNPSSISLGGNTEIIVTITDSAGNPVIYSGSINLSLSDPNKGSLSLDDYDEVTGTGTLTFSNESSKKITYTASDSDAGEVNITASVDDASWPLQDQDTVTIYIYEFLRIDLTANPEIITVDEESSSTITATIRDINSGKVTGGNYDIIFEIVSGDGYLSGDFQTIMQNSQNGEASIELTPTTTPSIITVSARAENLISDSVTVQSTIPKFISISADKDWLYEGEEAVISIDVVDSGEESVEYEGSIILTLSGFGLGSIDTNTLSYPGEDTAYFTALSNGEVTITADGDFINSDFITIPILEKITFEDNIIILDIGNTITFDISVGGVALEIVQMNITWDSPSTLNKICFSTTGTCFNYNPAVDSLGLTNIETPTTLSVGVSTISLYFSGDMNGKTITVLFFDNNLQYGPLEFTVIP